MITATPPYDNASLGGTWAKITSNFICHGYSLHHGMAQCIYIYMYTQHRGKENCSQVSGCKWLILPTKSHSHYNESRNKED